MLIDFLTYLGWPIELSTMWLAGITWIMITLLMPGWIRLMSQQTHQVREDVPERHLGKQGTPSMGGVPWLLVLFGMLLLGLNIASSWVWMMGLLMLGYSMVGIYDDWGKRHRKDLSAKHKFFSQIVIALGVLVIWAWNDDLPHVIWIPFWHTMDVGHGYIAWAIFILIGSSNASNLTDGLDGLLTKIWLTVCGGMLIIIAVLRDQLTAWCQPDELLITLVLMIVSGCAFYRFNRHPARIFMGDSGSIVLGPMVALIALRAHLEIFFAVMACVMVVETLSVIIQVVSFKTTGRRVFKMSPLHHHFELVGWSETKIVHWFWLVTVGCVGIICLCTYYLVA